MSAREFRPGDRVRHDNDPIGIDEKIVARYDGEGITFTDGSAVLPQGVRCLTLVSRPVYPEPGRVAVLLDVEDVQALKVVDGLLRAGRDIDNDAIVPRRIRAILERARESSR